MKAFVLFLMASLLTACAAKYGSFTQNIPQDFTEKMANDAAQAMRAVWPPEKNKLLLESFLKNDDFLSVLFCKLAKDDVTADDFYLGDVIRDQYGRQVTFPVCKKRTEQETKKLLSTIEEKDRRPDFGLLPALDAWLYRPNIYYEFTLRKIMIAFGDRDADFQYVLDQLGQGSPHFNNEVRDNQTYRLTLYFHNQSIGRLYTVKDGTLKPLSAWARQL
jgi:hypothetical protein